MIDEDLSIEAILALKQEKLNNADITEVARIEMEQRQTKLKKSLLELAGQGHPLASFAYSKEVYH